MINHFGLDIGTDLIKVVQVVNEKNSYTLLAAGVTRMPPVSLLSENDKDLTLIAEAIKKITKDAKISVNQVVLSIPERHVFTQIFEFPKMSEDELAQAIPWEAENLIPKPLSEVNLDWEVIEEASEQNNFKIKVLLVASQKDIIGKYLKILKIADLIPLSIETEALAVIRCLKNIIKNQNVIVANLGKTSSDIAIVKNGHLYLARSISTGGESITRSIGSALTLNESVAEEYKKTYGLTSQLEGKVASEIIPILSVVANEIKKAISFFEEKEHDHVKLLILSGGTSLLPGISEYFVEKFGIEVQIADSFTVAGISSQIDQGLKKDSPLFTVAIGLALKED